MNVQKNTPETIPPLVSGQNVLAQLNNKGSDPEEEKQRMMMLQLSTRNSLMLNSVTAQTENLFKLARKCMEELKSLK